MPDSTNIQNANKNRNIVPDIIKAYKKQNNWKGILLYYNITNFNEKLDENISIAELNEIFFAAGHYVYVLNALSCDKKSFKQVLLLYFWTHDNTKYWLTRYPESPALLRSYAYINYELSTGFGYSITRKARKIGLSDNDINKKLASLKRNAYSEARSAYEKILKSSETDIRSHYRYARLLKKECTANGYKLSAEARHKDGKLISWHFLKAKRLYESLTDEDKKQMYFSCYVKSLYNYAAYTFDVILPSLSLMLLLNAKKIQ